MKPSLKVDDQIALYLPKPEWAEPIFELIDSQRTYLREWLPWVDPTKSPNDTRIFLRDSMRFNRGGQRLTTFVFYEQELAGSLGFVHFNKGCKSGEIGYWLRQELQGKGIMTKSCKRLIDYVFRTKDLNRIEIKVASPNHKSQAIPRRLGFTHEATLREGLFLYDQYYDLELFSLLRKEWAPQ